MDATQARALRALLTVFSLGVVVGVAMGLLLGPPPRVVRFYSVPPDDLVAGGYLPTTASEKGAH